MTKHYSLSHDRFHDSEKGCVLDDHVTYRKFNPIKRQQAMVIDNLCVVHEIVVCKCGWEWGWHLGKNNNRTNL